MRLLRKHRDASAGHWLHYPIISIREDVMTAIDTTQTLRRFDVIAFVAIGVTILTWSSAFVAIRYSLAALPPIELAAARYGGAAIPAALYLIVSRSPLPRIADLLRLGVIGSLFVTAYSVLLNAGELTVPAGPAAFIINTMPIFVALIALPVLGERIGYGGWAGMLLSFAGIGLIAISSGDTLQLDIGAVLILAAAVCSAIASIIQKPLLTRMSPLTMTAWVLTLGALPFLAVAPQTYQALSLAPTPVLWSVVYLALVPTVIGYLTWATALKRLTAGRAANFLYCVPPMATLLGFVLLQEVPTPLGLIGCAVTIGGVLVFNALRKR